jgi:hypothetical protein
VCVCADLFKRLNIPCVAFAWPVPGKVVSSHLVYPF